MRPEDGTAGGDDARRIADRFGVAPLPAALAETAEGVSLIDAGADRGRIAAALRDGRHVVERADDGSVAGDWSLVPVDDGQGFFLSLTTATAFGAQSALAVCNALVERGVLGAEQRPSVELCLHEAIANAIVHGNLGIPSTTKDSAEGYRQFGQMVGERLRDPAVRARRVDLFVRWADRRLDLSVGDQGSGFDPAAVPEEPAKGARAGRGLIFMRSLATAMVISDGGRCTSLRFDL